MHMAIVVGTGFGGICAAINLQKLGIHNFIMLERRSFAGGTWMQNTYPGAAVDVQSPLYSLSAHPYPWSHLFAKQDELVEYTKTLFKQHQLYGHIKLNCQVEQASWKHDHWQLSLQSGEVLNCKILINATGPLSTPSKINFAHANEFTGKQFHCNDWPKDVSLKNKRVAIIGTGASAAQIIPEIIDEVAQLHVFQREPHWVLPRSDWKIPRFLKRFLALRPINAIIRSFIYWSLELRVIGFKYSPLLLKLLAAKPAKKHLERQVKDSELRQKLTPNFTIGCKRILLSNTYYPALQSEHCDLHTKEDAIEQFTAKGIKCKTSGNIDLDIIVHATGYNAVDSMVSYRVLGKDGHSLASKWHSYPRAYLGTSVPNFPNFFIVTGPNTGIGHTSAIFVIESQMKYIMHCVNLLSFKGAKTIEPSIDAEQRYTSMVHQEMDKTVWANGGCNSWYQNNEGKVIAMFPGFSFTFRRLCKKFNKQDHLITR